MGRDREGDGEYPDFAESADEIRERTKWSEREDDHRREIESGS